MNRPRKFFTSSIVDFSSSIRQNREAFNLSIFDFGPFGHVQWFDFSVNGEFAFDTSPEKSEFKIEFGVHELQYIAVRCLAGSFEVEASAASDRIA